MLFSPLIPCTLFSSEIRNANQLPEKKKAYVKILSEQFLVGGGEYEVPNP